jgi:hypothetical protein
MTKKKQLTLLIAINIFHLALWAYIGTQKGDYHYDEYFTFIQSNNYYTHLYELADGQIYPMSVFEELGVVDRDHRFDFSIAYRSLPWPSYLMLEHFAYSFIPGVASPWPGFIINFIALTLAAYSVFFITREIWKDDVAALFVMAVFGTMYGVVNMAVLIRMYCLLMMWAGGLVLWHLREKKNHLLLVPIVVLGAFTHYYFFVLLIFTAIYYGVGLLIRKKWGDIWLYGGAMAIAAGLYLLGNPQVFSAFTSEGNRASQAVEQAQTGGLDNSVASYTRLLFESLCAETPALLFGVLAIIAAFVWLCVKCHKLPAEKVKPLLFIAIPALLCFLIIARIAPYIVYRYISIVLPSLCVVFYGLLYQAVKLFGGKGGWRVLAAVVLSAFVLLGLRRTVYLPFECYPHYQSIHDMYAEIIANNREVSVVYVYLNPGGDQQFVHHYQGLREARYLQGLRFENMALYTPFPADGEIILIIGPMTAETLGGQTVASRLQEVSGKSQATFMGLGVDDAEAWLLK